MANGKLKKKKKKAKFNAIYKLKKQDRQPLNIMIYSRDWSWSVPLESQRNIRVLHGGGCIDATDGLSR